MPLQVLEAQTGENPVATILIMHGLGADGRDFVPIAQQMDLSSVGPVRYLFPNAPTIPVTINGGYVMRAWYDIKNVDLQRQEDEGGIRQSQAVIEELIEDQIALGFTPEKIVLAGFSQGGAIAYQTGFRSKYKVAGVVTLSTYLPCESSLDTEFNQHNTSIPVMAAHGSQDNIVLIERGEKAVEMLRKKGVQVEWFTYPMAHSVCGEEVVEIAEFLKKVL